MSKTELKREGELNGIDGADELRGGESRPGRRSGGDAPAVRAGGSPVRIYKPGQGAYVRWSTAAAAGVVALAFSSFLFDQLKRFPALSDQLVVRYLIPVLALAVIGVVVFHFLGRSRKTVDFMIATEGEMRKVNWSTRKEVFGATRVVIFTVVMLGFILFVVDILFMMFFRAIGVLRVGGVSEMFGSSG